MIWLALGCGVLIGAGWAMLLAAGRAVRDAEHIEWLERDLDAARAAARRIDAERVALVGGRR